MSLKWFLIFVTVWCTSDAYKILTIFPIPGRSHGILGETLTKRLLDAGHEVTHITAFPKKQGTPNLTEIDVTMNKKHFDENTINIKGVMDGYIDFTNREFLMNMFYTLSTATVSNPNVQKLLRDPKQKFDVIVGEYMFSETYATIPAVFDCPFIWFSTIEPHWMITSIVDEILHPAYNSDFLNGRIAPLSFVERVHELWSILRGLTQKYYKMHPLEKEVYKNWIVPVLEEKGKPIPTFEELVNNVSLVLGNSHVSLGQPTKLPPIYKSVGGYHIDEYVPPLPEDLQKIMDNAKHGVIYFSMGSNLKSKDLPVELKRDFLRILSELKETVLWKFEEVLPDIPKNVYIVKWAPQPSILSHPNCKLFITHGGLLSTTETIRFGVPIIGIPVFADQFINVNVAEKRGFAKKVSLTYTMAQEFKDAIEEMLNNPKYKRTVEMYSLIYKDRPVTPIQELVHWVEHVAKTKGALHLRSPALHVPFYQKLYLDLLAVVLIILLVVIRVIRRIFCRQPKDISKTKTN